MKKTTNNKLILPTNETLLLAEILKRVIEFNEFLNNEDEELHTLYNRIDTTLKETIVSDLTDNIITLYFSQKEITYLIDYTDLFIDFFEDENIDNFFKVNPTFVPKQEDFQLICSNNQIELKSVLKKAFKIISDLIIYEILTEDYEDEFDEDDDEDFDDD